MNGEPQAEARVRELRLVVTAPNFDEALHFYRDVLGLSQRAAYQAAGGRVVILEAGQATLELTDPIHAAYIDEVEVGRRVAGHIRVAFEVADSPAVEPVPIAPVGLGRRLVRQCRRYRRRPDFDHGANAKRGPDCS